MTGELQTSINNTPRRIYSFEELEAAMEFMPNADPNQISGDYTHVGTLMVDSSSDYFVYVNESGQYIKLLQEKGKK